MPMSARSLDELHNRMHVSRIESQRLLCQLLTNVHGCFQTDMLRNSRAASKRQDAHTSKMCAGAPRNSWGTVMPYLSTDIVRQTCGCSGKLARQKESEQAANCCVGVNERKLRTALPRNLNKKCLPNWALMTPTGLCASF